MQRPVAWLAALLLVACSDRHPVELTAPRPSPASVNREVVITDPQAAYGVMLSSAALAGQIPLGTAAFGQQVIATPGYVLEGQLVRTPASSLPTDFVAADGCTPFAGNNIAGNIVLIDRGTCSFATKVRNAENAGAVAVIISDNQVAALPQKMAGDGINTVDIPAFSVTRANGTTLKDALLQSGFVSVQLLVTPVDAPTVRLPDDITTDATSSAGAVVSFSVSGTVYMDLGTVGCAPPSGSNFTVGTTTVTCSAVDLWSNTASGTFTVTVKPLDTTPPTLTVSPNVVADATSPAGAVVTYAVTATDASGSATLTCAPQSGSTFPIGMTMVGCQAGDASGNVATGFFSVTVKAANAQITDLQKSVAGLDLQEGTETSVQAKLAAALDALNAHDVVDACGSLGALINQISAQTGKKISLADAQALIATAQRIRSAAGC
jgi:alpha-D-ribose 1-methylphosphonate 5-triphosphate synthase subunit PhnG